MIQMQCSIKHSNYLLQHDVVDQNPPTGVDRQHESREARSLYLSALQPARALRLTLAGHATGPIPGQEGV
jgi:hypothetical protein